MTQDKNGYTLAKEEWERVSRDEARRKKESLIGQLRRLVDREESGGSDAESNDADDHELHHQLSRLSDAIDALVRQQAEAAQPPEHPDDKLRRELDELPPNVVFDEQVDGRRTHGDAPLTAEELARADAAASGNQPRPPDGRVEVTVGGKPVAQRSTVGYGKGNI